MSLDVSLYYDDHPHNDAGSGIFIREDGQTKQITREEWDELFPGREPVVVQVGVSVGHVFDYNITHNLTGMAEEAGIYKHLWRPEEVGIEVAGQLVGPLTDGLAMLQSEPERFRAFNPSNGWGNYDGLCLFVATYLAACIDHPTAKICVSR